METVNGGGLASTLLHIVGCVAATTVGMVTGPVGAIATGLTFVAANEIVDRVS
jgi:hypothetical protein